MAKSLTKLRSQPVSAETVSPVSPREHVTRPQLMRPMAGAFGTPVEPQKMLKMSQRRTRQMHDLGFKDVDARRNSCMFCDRKAGRKWYLRRLGWSAAKFSSL